MIADAFVIVLRNDEGGFDISYVVDLGREYAPRHNEDIPAIYHESMERHVPIIIETATHADFANWDRYGDMTRRVQSILIAPLYRGAEAIGTLSAQSYASNAYRQRDADLLSTVANVAAVAIENARLYEQAHGAAVAEERNRLAREIHDTIAQGLVGIILQLEAVSASLGDDSESPLQRRLTRAINLARVNLDEARRSVRDLRAAPLEHMSLSEALVQLAEQHEEECETDVHIDVPEAMPLLDPTVETALFRFVQESLSNCRKHARTSTVWIHARVEESLAISVRDNGPGFDVDAYRREGSGHHFGLHGMRERIERLGGTLQIESRIGGGTQLGIRLPLTNVAPTS
jgi:two-component system NarL family sensor kinase